MPAIRETPAIPPSRSIPTVAVPVEIRTMKRTTFSFLILPFGFTMAAMVGVSFLSTANAEPPANPVSPSLVRTVLQDEIDELPEDNIAFFTSARKVKLQLDLLVAADSQTNLQANLSKTVVTVVRPDGKITRLKPDALGKVTIEQIESGPHAVVASADGAHGTMLYYFDQKKSKDVLEKGLATPRSTTTTKRLTMLQLAPEQLRLALDRIRDLNSADLEAPARVDVGDTFNYSVTLGPDGTLSGRVMSVIASLSTVGTHITIFHAGQPVGSTVAGTDGSFQISGLRGGIHGVVASGRAGFSAFAFDASQPSEMADGDRVFKQTFVSSALQGDEQLPVVLCPPPMTAPVIKAIEKRYPMITSPVAPAGADVPLGAMDGLAGTPVGPPVAGFSPGSLGSSAGGGFSGSGFSGGGTGGGFSGGGGGLAGLSGLAGVGAIIAASTDDDNDAIPRPPIASPSLPGTGAN